MRTLPKISYYLRQWRCIRCGAFDFGSNSCTSKKKSHINVKGSKCWVDGKVFFLGLKWARFEYSMQPAGNLINSGLCFISFSLFFSMFSVIFCVLYSMSYIKSLSKYNFNFFYEFFMTVFLLIKTVHRIFTRK